MTLYCLSFINLVTQPRENQCFMDHSRFLEIVDYTAETLLLHLLTVYVSVHTRRAHVNVRQWIGAKRSRISSPLLQRGRYSTALSRQNVNNYPEKDFVALISRNNSRDGNYKNSTTMGCDARSMSRQADQLH